MNLPNILTLTRFFLIPIFIIIYFQGYETLAFIIFLLAGLTDILDGYLARKYDLTTELGSMLDPLADKLMVLTVVFSLLITDKIPWIVAAIIIIRDGGMILGALFFHFKGKKTVPANKLGKLTTVFFYIAILLVTFKLPYHIQFLWFVIIFSLITSIVYLMEHRKVNKKDLYIEIDYEYKDGATASNE